jgi:hypothetical protein
MALHRTAIPLRSITAGELIVSYTKHMIDNKLQDRIQKSPLLDPMKQHLKLCIEVGKRHRWHDALEEDLETVVQKTLEVVNAACSNTRQNPDSLFRGADFDPSDLDPDRLDAAIAEADGRISMLSRALTLKGYRYLRKGSL